MVIINDEGRFHIVIVEIQVSMFLDQESRQQNIQHSENFYLMSVAK